MKSETTFELLRREVIGGVADADGRLPTERDLAGRMGVSRGTLRRALARLEMDGLIWRGVGRGTYLRGYEPRADGAAAIVLDTTNPMEVMEARITLEPELTAVAALKVTSAQIAELDKAIDHGRGATTVGQFEKCDSDFHRQIARTVGNSLLLGLFDALNAARDGALWGKLKAQSLTPELMQRYCDQHLAVVDALRHRDRLAAASAMKDHLHEVRMNLLGL